MARVVASVFSTVSDAELAIRELMNAGITDEKIGVVVNDRDIGPGIADDLGREYRVGMKSPTNEITNAADVYADLPGGFITVMRGETTGAGMSSDELLRWYTNQLNDHKVLVIVNDDLHANTAMQALSQHHGMMPDGQGRMTATGPSMETPTTTTVPLSTPASTPSMPTDELHARQEAHVPIIDEEVVLEKTVHQLGQLEVTSETSAEPIDVPTTVTHDEIRVERRKLDRPLSPTDYQGATATPGVIRMPIIEEEVRVTKTPIVREELVITRLPVAEQQTLHETVMHSEPRLETQGDFSVDNPANADIQRIAPDMTKKEPPTDERKRRPAA